MKICPQEGNQFSSGKKEAGQQSSREFLPWKDMTLKTVVVQTEYLTGSGQPVSMLSRIYKPI